MAFIIPNTGDTVSGAKFESLDQAEPDSLDFEILGNIGRSGVLTGCQVSTNGNNSDVQVSAGVVVIAGVPYTVSAVSALSLGTLPSHVQFSLVVARVSAGSVSLVLVNGNDDPTNPTYPKTPNTSTSGTIDLSTDVVLAAIHRDGNKAVTASSIVDKRTMLSSSVFSQGTSTPSGGTTGSLYYKTDVAEGATGTGLYIRNASGTWIEAAQLSNNNVTDAQLRDSTGLSVIGRSANSTGDPADIVAGTDGQVLRRSGSTLGFGTIAAAGIANDAVTNDKLRNSSALSVIGNSTNATGDPADIVAGTDHHVLRRSGSTLGFGTVAGDGIADDSIDSRHYVDLSIDTAHLSDNVVTNTKLRDSSAASVIGRAATTAGDPADIAIGTNRVLGRTTGNLISTQVQTDMIANDAINGDKIADNAVTLGTHTTGNYVAGITSGTGISVTGTAGEGWSPTVAINSADVLVTGSTDQSKSGKLTLTENVLGNDWTGAQLVINPGGNAGISLRTGNEDDQTIQLRSGGNSISGRSQLYLSTHNNARADIGISDLLTETGYVYVSPTVNKIRIKSWAAGQPWAELECGTLGVNGSVWVNGVQVHSSSRDIKHDILSVESGYLDKINSLNPVYYRFNEDPDTVHVGFIAEEVEDCIPLAVSDKGAVKGIDPVALLSSAVAAIQELSAKVESLEARLSELEG